MNWHINRNFEFVSRRTAHNWTLKKLYSHKSIIHLKQINLGNFGFSFAVLQIEIRQLVCVVWKWENSDKSDCYNFVQWNEDCVAYWTSRNGFCFFDKFGIPEREQTKGRGQQRHFMVVERCLVEILNEKEKYLSTEQKYWFCLFERLKRYKCRAQKIVQATELAK